ncbi:hypothetical protein ACGTNG_04625 [Halomonas sp. 1390]|uniref:hypothetical protein n=1 Tax=Halomonas sp. B23F22_3 TaxID=3459516 RepID=UPI00373EB8DD
MSEGPFLPPRLTLRVGVTGHRPNKLAEADTDLLQQRAGAVLGCLAEVARRIQAESDAAGAAAPFATGVAPHLRFATAIAAGADSFTADAAIVAGYDLNIVLPFPHAAYVAAQDFTRNERTTFNRLWAHAPERTTRTELDVANRPGDDEAYRAAGRLVLAHSDVLLAVWDGEAAAGTGGTAEIVAEAQQLGLVVVWLALDGALRLWTTEPGTTDPAGEGHWRELEIEETGDPCSNPLAAGVRHLLRLPEAVSKRHGDSSKDSWSPQICLVEFRETRLRTYAFACAYNCLHWLFRLSPPLRPWVDYTASEAHAGPHWARVGDIAREIGGEPFATAIETKLQERWRRADNVANHYAHMYRSAYVLNFTLAALAVTAGLLVLPLAVPFYDSILWLKAWLVVTELAFIGMILWITWRGNRDCWHQRWLDYRNIAEALRPARLPILMGSSPIGPGSLTGATPGEAWVAWYVRASLREITPPTAVIGPDALGSVIDVAIDCEIDDQIAYHQSNADRLHALDDRMENTAVRLLLGTLLAGAFYLAAYGYVVVTHDKALVKEVVKPLATFFGGVLPVYGAALFGIRATGDFRSSVQQSERMIDELGVLKTHLQGQRAAPNRARLHRTLARVTRTLADDLHFWGVIYSERALEPGF